MEAVSAVPVPQPQYFILLPADFFYPNPTITTVLIYINFGKQSQLKKSLIISPKVKKKLKIKYLVCSWFVIILINNGNLITVVVIGSSLIRNMVFTTCMENML